MCQKRFVLYFIGQHTRSVLSQDINAVWPQCCFWMLAQMIRKYNMKGFFSTNVPQFKCAIETFAILVQKLLPELHAFFVCCDNQVAFRLTANPVLQLSGANRKSRACRKQCSPHRGSQQCFAAQSFRVMSSTASGTCFFSMAFRSCTLLAFHFSRRTKVCPVHKPNDRTREEKVYPFVQSPSWRCRSRS